MKATTPPVPGADPGAELERLFAEALPDIEAVCRSVGRRYRMREAELDDLESMVKLSIITSGYRVLARFEGRCALRTYLRTVVVRLVLDARRKEFGKWRASARARRDGPLAMTLERLIHQQGRSREEAIQEVISSHPAATTRQALYELALCLPARPPRWSALPDPGDLAEFQSPDETPEACLQRARGVALAQRAIAGSLDGLSDSDLLLLRLRFEEELTIADIARILGLKAKHLYRRMESMLGELRDRMRDRGVAWTEVAPLVEQRCLELRWPERAAPASAECPGASRVEAAA